MKLSFGGITSFARFPLAWATASLSVLWGCQHYPGSRSSRTPDDVVCYQNVAAPYQQSSPSSYEESSNQQFNDPAPDVPPPPVEEPTFKPKSTSPNLPPLPDPPDMTVPSKKPATPAPTKDEPKKAEPKEPASEKSAESKPADTDKPASPKKKPAKSKTKKSKKSVTDGSDIGQESEEIDFFAPDEETDAGEQLELPESATALAVPQRLTQTILEVPTTSESHDSAPRPREIPSATDNGRSASDRQPMLLAPQPPELKLPNAPTSVDAISLAPSNSSTNPASATAEKTTGASPSDAVLTLDAHCDHLVFDQQGFGYVTHRKRIVRFSPKGETVTWTALTNPRGHQVESDGTHLVCDVDHRAVLRLSFDGKIIGTAAKDCDGTPLRAPYDLTLDGRGGIYFTDPGFLQMESPVGKLHYVDRSGQVSLVAAQLGYPTGISYDSVHNRVLVVESLTARILELQLGEPGCVESTRIFAELPKTKNVDYHMASLCQTRDGTLFVTQPQARTVQVFNTTGRPIGHLTTGELSPNRVALRSLEATEVFISGVTSAEPRHGKVIRIALGE